MPKLMLVEDDNNLREIYEARLQAEGYEIVTAKDGEEALVLAKAEKPDLIISDVMMPKISGFEMLDILRNTEGLKQVKVVMLTALGQNDDQKLANRLGTDRYLAKSQVTLEDIVKVTHELLGDQVAATNTAAAAPSAPATAVSAPMTPASTPDPTPAPPPPEPTPNPTPVEPPTTPPAIETPAPATPAVSAAPTPSASDDSPVNNEVSDAAQSTVQEEASVDGRIEDFVAGATEEPTATATPSIDAPAESITTPAEPAIEATPEPTPPPIPPATPDPQPTPALDSSPTPNPTPPPAEPTAPSADNTANDDKLVADAADKLVASTEDKPAETPAPTTAAAPDAPKMTQAETDERRTKRIIQPIDTGPKQDLDTLLALEEAKEASTTAPPPAAPVVVIDTPGEHIASPAQSPVIAPAPLSEDAPSGAPASSAQPVVTTPNDPADPNNIAL